MALSLSGRKLFAEVAGTLAIFAVGAVVLTHRPQTQEIITQLLGIQFKPAGTDGRPVVVADDGIVKASRGRSVELAAGSFGHFFADAEVNGRSVHVVVDTGASMVALTYDDARRAGLSPRDADFTGRSTTANGIARFAPIMIDRLSIGDIEVRDVEAAVMEDGKLETTLLGMSFLRKLNVNMRAGRLVLEE